MLDQVAVAASAVGAQAPQQLHRLEQIGFAFAVRTDHQQPGSHQGQLQSTDIAKTQQLQAVQPDGSEAVSS